MASVNQATVVGYAGDDPNIATAQNGSTIASISIGTTEKGFTRQDGTKVEDKTEWHNIVAFGRLADVVKNFVRKGSLLYVQGKMRTRSYQSNKDGTTRYITEIVADTLQMLDRKPTAQNYTPGQQPGSSYYDPPF